ncbi:MAG TPA: AraC family transcriptional regulator [Rhizomicrobium sp.]
MSAAQRQADRNGFWERIEAHIAARLFEPLSVASLAVAAGLSPYHFCRAFTARFGESPMSYVRSLRLAHAAQRLEAPNPPALTELAFDSGFESQEAFTRAFRRAYGAPPGQFKRDAKTIRIERERVMTAAANVKLDLVQQPEPVKRAAFAVAGASARFNDDTKNQIPLLWPKLIRHLPLAGQRGYHTYGVSWGGLASDGSFRYMAGVEVAPDATLPEGLELWPVPAQTYLVFRQTLDGGEIHPQMRAATEAIWSRILPNAPYKLANGPDFEDYAEDFAPLKTGATVDYYVPILTG